MRKKYFYILYLLICFFIAFDSFPQSNLQTTADKFSAAMDAYNSSQYIKANRLFEEFFKNYELMDELYASAKYYSSQSLLNIGKTDEAAAGFEFIVNNFHWTNFRDISLYKLGLIYFTSAEYFKSRINFKQILDEYPESEYIGSSLYWIGESYTQEDKLDEAIHFLEEAVTKQKNNKYIDYSIYTLASAYERVGDYDNAVKYYDELLSYHKESKLAPSTQVRIGICYFKLKDYQSAILELSSPLISDLPQDLYSESLYILANAYYRVQEYDKAEDTYLDIIQNYPNSDVIREVKYGLGWAYFQQGKYNDAYKMFNNVSEGDDSIAIKSFYWKAEAKRYDGHESEALDIYKEFMQKYPDAKIASGVQYQMGVLSYGNMKFESAEKYLEEAMSSTDDDIKARAYILKGEIELNKKKFNEAKESFENAINITGETSGVRNRAMLGMGASLFYLNQPDEAISYLTRIDSSSSEMDKINFYLAESYFAKSDYSKALGYYNNIDQQNDKVWNSTLYGKAYTYFNLRQFENASEQFSDFVKRYPNDQRIVDAKLRLADSYYGSKNFSAAGKIYKELFNLNTDELDNPYAHYQYAQALYKAGNSEEALNEFRSLQENFPNSDYADESLYIVGWIRFQQNNFKEAINNYKIALNKYPGSAISPIIYYSIGDAYFNLEKYDSAIVNYQKVITNYPSSNYVYDAVNGIQYSYVVKGEPEKAVKLIDEFVGNNPGLSFSDQIFFKKGETYYSLGKYEEAKLGYKEFVANYPRSELISDAYYWIGKCAQNLNQNEEAIFNFNKVLESYPKSEAAASSVIEIGNVYNNIKNYDAAISTFDKAVKKLSDSPRISEILFMKGETLVNKGDVSSAYEVFDEVIQYYKGTIFADKAKLELGLIELAAKRFENAEFYFKSLAESRTDDLGAKAQYYYGVTLFEEEKFSDAITALVRVRSIFPAYNEWVTRSVLKLGDCYVEIEDFDKAKEMYRTVLSAHRGDTIGKEAQEKLNKIR